MNLRALTHSLSRKETLDEKVERALGALACEMVDDVVEFACRLARHRGSKVLHRNDVKLAFSKRYGIKVPVKQQPSGAHGTTATSAAQTAGGGQVAVLPVQAAST